jgi:hypothetical protein
LISLIIFGGAYKLWSSLRFTIFIWNIFRYCVYLIKQGENSWLQCEMCSVISFVAIFVRLEYTFLFLYMVMLLKQLKENELVTVWL